MRTLAEDHHIALPWSLSSEELLGLHTIYIHGRWWLQHSVRLLMFVGFKRTACNNDDTARKLKCIREDLVKERITTAHKNKASSCKGANDKILSAVKAIMDSNVENRWHDVLKEPANCAHNPNMCNLMMSVAHPIHERRNRWKQRSQEPIDISISQWQSQQKHAQMTVAVLRTNIHNVEPLTDNNSLLHFEHVTGVLMDDTFLCEVQPETFAGQMFTAGYDLFLCDANKQPVTHTHMVRFSEEETHQP
jgi:hypothetical protein